MTIAIIGQSAAFRLGVRDGLVMPFWMVLGSMIGFGSMARDSGVSLGVALGASFGIWGLPGQVAMVELFAVGLPVFAIVVASSMANMRFMPMCVVLMPHFRGNPTAVRWRYVLAQMLSINIWTVFMRRGPTLADADRLPFYLGVSIICLVAGGLGTTLGYEASGLLPLYVTVSLVFLNPAYFVFVFSSVRQRNCIIAVLVGAVAGPLLYQITPDWSVPVTGLLAGTAAFIIDKSMKVPA
ncbi:MAG: AzlC family ABC transporter permease [Rhodospirillales bacterium]|nr:AzlC family ABC transporter permease [Rhodospirillales bacterium]